MKYTVNKNLMIRTPSFSINGIKELLDGDYREVFNFLHTNKYEDIFHKSIRVSSSSLFNSINLLNKHSKSYNNVCLSTYKYLLRSCLRTTPYAMFSAVSLGEFINNNNSVIRDLNINVQVSIDNGWLYSAINKIENSENFYKQLKVIWNSACYSFKTRVRNSSFSEHGLSSNMSLSNSSIRHTNLIKLIQSNSSQLIYYSDLFNIIQNTYNDVSSDLIHETLKLLIDEEYLFTELRPIAYCNDNLEYLIEKLEKYNSANDYLVTLKKLNLEIKRNNAGNSWSVSAFSEIENSMSTFLKSNNYLQVNSSLNLLNSVISDEIKEKIERFTEALTFFPLERATDTKLEKLKRAFQEEFGQDVEVPLIDFLDPLGFNAIRFIEESKEKTEKEILIQSIIDKKIQEAIINGNTKVDLGVQDFSFLDRIESFELPDSIDLNFLLTSKEDGVEIALGPNIGAQCAGMSFQRFEKVFDKNKFEDYRNIYKESSNWKYTYVEVKEMVNNGRHANVENYSCNYDYYLILGMPESDINKQKVSLEDLLVGLDFENKLYIKSKKINKKCKFITDNMLNKLFRSDLCKLLCIISDELDEYGIIERLLLLNNCNYIYTPAIYIEGICAALEKWRFSHLSQELSKTDFTNLFDNFTLKYKLPEYFYLCDYDNRIVLKKGKEETYTILYNEYRNKKSLELSVIEEGLLDKGFVIDTIGNSYVCEIVTSLYKENINNLISNDLLDNKELISNNRIIYPFQDGWLYIKLYCNEEFSNDILLDLENNNKRLGYDKFFFIRYFDDKGFHLRVRFKYSNTETSLKMHLNLQKWIKAKFDEGLLSEWGIYEYHRELNRYGGENCIDAVESFFFDNSKRIINNELQQIKNNEELTEIYFKSIVTLLGSLTNDKTEMLNLLNTVVSQNENRDLYKKDRKKYISLFDSVYGSLKEHPQYANLVKCIIEKSDNRASNRSNILLSFLHMNCNRITGDRDLEELAYSLVRHSLHDSIMRGNNYHGNE